MFCARCGKKIKSYGLCINCYLELNPIYIENFEIHQCPKCENFTNGKENYEATEIKNKIIKNLRVPEKVVVKKIDVKYNINFFKIFEYDVKIYGEYNGEEFSKEISGNLKILKKLCQECSRILNGYYEVIIQLRNNKEKIKKAMKFFDANKKFVSKIDETKNGYDVYLTSKEFANSLIKTFVDEGAEIKLSKSIGGMKDGSTVYRKCILVKFHDLNVSDYVLFKNKVYKILKVKKILICERDNKIKRIPINKVVKIQKDKLSEYLNADK